MYFLHDKFLVFDSNSDTHLSNQQKCFQRGNSSKKFLRVVVLVVVVVMIVLVVVVVVVIIDVVVLVLDF